MGKTSRDKGNRGELEVAKILASLWKRNRGELEVAKILASLWRAPDCKRSAQVDGTLTADVVNALACSLGMHPGWHIEVKRVATIPAKLRTWLRQTEADAVANKAPGALVFREDGGQWYITMPLAGTVEFADDLTAQLVRWTRDWQRKMEANDQ